MQSYSLLARVFLLLALAATSAWAVEIDDAKVEKWIGAGYTKAGEAVGDAKTKIAKLYTVEELKQGWTRLKHCRDLGNADLHLAAAEHYVFARLIAASQGDTAYRKLPKWYETAKSFANKLDLEKYIQSSDQPVSPVNAKVTKWGENGIERGLADYKQLTGQDPKAGSAAVETLIASSYGLYYYPHRKATGVCDVQAP
ncbi:MAG: hypothetical protein JWL59_4846 [Chthoniobacteraceae bacterium]|nr:hypothetical protein [Chthoniobacteraceae bacterium]